MASSSIHYSYPPTSDLIYQPTFSAVEVEDHLTNLFNSMTLARGWDAKAVSESDEQTRMSSGFRAAHDAVMSDSSDSEDSTYLPSPPVSSSLIASNDLHPLRPSSAPTPTLAPAQSVPITNGCNLLQHLTHQLQAGKFSTTGGDYLEAIFTHREAFYAFPQGHRSCALGFSEIAAYMEGREWRADREGDMEAAAAFRYEAGMIASNSGDYKYGI